MWIELIKREALKELVMPLLAILLVIGSLVSITFATLAQNESWEEKQEQQMRIQIEDQKPIPVEEFVSEKLQKNHMAIGHLECLENELYLFKGSYSRLLNLMVEKGQLTPQELCGLVGGVDMWDEDKGDYVTEANCELRLLPDLGK